MRMVQVSDKRPTAEEVRQFVGQMRSDGVREAPPTAEEVAGLLRRQAELVGGRAVPASASLTSSAGKRRQHGVRPDRIKRARSGRSRSRGARSDRVKNERVKSEKVKNERVKSENAEPNNVPTEAVEARWDYDAVVFKRGP